MKRFEWDVATFTDPRSEIDADAAAAEIRNESRGTDEMYKGALYTYRCVYVTKRVGRGRAMSQAQYAAHLGISPSYVTMLRRLGRALVIHGVPPHSPLWTALAHAANRREIGAILDSDGPVDLKELANRLSLTPRSDVPNGSTSLEQAEHAVDALSRLLPVLRAAERQQIENRLAHLLSLTSAERSDT